MNENAPVIIWFRHDLRLIDNPALHHAVENGAPIIPIFIYDPDVMDRDYGGAQKWWLHHALGSLRNDFKQSYNVDLIVTKGNSITIINDLIEKTSAACVYWNRAYEKWSIDRDTYFKTSLQDRGLHAQSFQANLLFEPWTIKNKTGDPYRVFTPFFKACLAQSDMITPPLPKPSQIQTIDHDYPIGDIDELGLIPSIRWDEKMMDHWDITEQGAWNRLKKFFNNGFNHYKGGRDIPSQDNTSRLSPYLRWGMISPKSIWHETHLYAMTHNVEDKHRDHFLSEVGWREFSFHLLYYNPDMQSKPLQPRFEKFPWRDAPDELKKWEQGQTGYPLIDAGMRQLWATGWMHNRVRMIVGSLLVKHLVLSWQDGEAWFWDTLVDACPANNTAGWQWIGGCGADAAPYFRIFNPITQGDKFDAYDYVRTYVPELAKIDDKYLFNPWDAPVPPSPSDYPAPIIDHKQGRERALSAFEVTKL